MLFTLGSFYVVLRHFSSFLDASLHLYDRLSVGTHTKTHSFKISNHKKAKSTLQKMADFHPNKALYTATKVACEWEGVVIKKANQAFG